MDLHVDMIKIKDFYNYLITNEINTLIKLYNRKTPTLYDNFLNKMSKDLNFSEAHILYWKLQQLMDDIKWPEGDIDYSFESKITKFPTSFNPFNNHNIIIDKVFSPFSSMFLEVLGNKHIDIDDDDIDDNEVVNIPGPSRKPLPTINCDSMCIILGKPRHWTLQMPSPPKIITRRLCDLCGKVNCPNNQPDWVKNYPEHYKLSFHVSFCGIEHNDDSLQLILEQIQADFEFKKSQLQASFPIPDIVPLKCIFTIEKGKRKGQPCGKPTTRNKSNLGYCSTHYKRKELPHNLDSQLLDLESEKNKLMADARIKQRLRPKDGYQFCRHNDTMKETCMCKGALVNMHYCQRNCDACITHRDILIFKKIDEKRCVPKADHTLKFLTIAFPTEIPSKLCEQAICLTISKIQKSHQISPTGKTGFVACVEGTKKQHPYLHMIFALHNSKKKHFSTDIIFHFAKLSLVDAGVKSSFIDRLETQYFINRDAKVNKGFINIQTVFDIDDVYQYVIKDIDDSRNILGDISQIFD